MTAWDLLQLLALLALLVGGAKSAEVLYGYLLGRRRQRSAAPGARWSDRPVARRPRGHLLAWPLWPRRTPRRDGDDRPGPSPRPVLVRPRDGRLGPVRTLTPSIDCTRGNAAYRAQRDLFIRSLQKSGRHIDELLLVKDEEPCA